MTQLLSSSEVKKHNTRKSLWIVINNEVYDVTSYLNEHPGGEDPLLEAAGQDATRAFEDVGHSDDAREIMRKFKIGSLAKGECCSESSRRKDDKKPWRTFDSPRGSGTIRNQTSSASSSKVKLPLPRVQSVIVPRESGTIRNQTRSESSSKVKLPLPRAQSVIVPRERRRDACKVCKSPPPSPSGSSKLKWALLALGIAIIVGVSYKKYVAS